MKDRELEALLRRGLGRERAPRHLEETVRVCRLLAARQAAAPEERRQSFWGFLSDVFHFEGIPLLLSQLVVFFAACLAALASPMGHYELPMYMPMFILAVMPVFFRGQICRVSEVEAATRTSGALLTLARLVLAGGGALVCLTFLLGLKLYLQRSCESLGRMVIYCLVPYLTCMTTMLALVRRSRKGGAPLCAAIALGSVFFWRHIGTVLPWLYEASALGIWIAAVLIYSWLFAKEITYIIHANKEVNMYGIVDR